jgi:hypothetical protein
MRLSNHPSAYKPLYPAVKISRGLVKVALETALMLTYDSLQACCESCRC